MFLSYRLESMDTNDFEKFAVELVKRKFNNERFRGFAPGKDDGIDGIDDIKNPTLILQAKRWTLSKNSSTAINELKREIDKIIKNIEKYKWDSNFRYVIVTSLKLTPNRCKEIRDYADEKYKNLIPSDEYIIYSSYLETLSNDEKYRDIFERFQLLEKDLSFILREERLRPVEIESLHYFSGYNYKYFAETKFLEEAYYRLQENRILLIQGPPGIGKTTTCMMLGNILRSIKEIKFDAIMRKITDIDKVIELFNSSYINDDDKALFVVFDDFLGRNKFDIAEQYLPDLNKIYIAAKKSKNLYICFNSRTQILKDAKNLNSNLKKLINSEFREEEISILDLSNYNKTEKALIFRKSFERKFANLSKDKKNDLADKYNSLIGCSWHNIVEHKNFYPRIIELIVDNYKDADDIFYKYIKKSLDNPYSLYENIFYNLNVEEKYLLFIILLFDEYPVPKDKIIKSFHTLDKYPEFDIEKALYKLEDSWLLPIKDSIYGEVKINFLNPSIIDFLNYKKDILANILKKIVENSIYLSQVHGYYGKSKNNKQFLKEVLEKWNKFEDKENYIGEKIIAIITLCKLEQYKNEMQSLLMSFKGEVLNSSKITWKDIVDAISYSGNLELKKDFLFLLDNNSLSDNILETRLLDSYDLDSIAENIDSIIDDVFNDLDDEYSTSKLSETDYYDDFRMKKVSILQDYIDSDATFFDINDIPSDAIESKIMDYINIVSEEIENQITQDYQWTGIDKNELDYEGLIDYIKESIKDQVKNLNENLYTQKKKNNSISDSETIENILNKPLA
ncbi:ATP-binding protein [Macrococcoides caseolyticum]